MRFYAPEEKEKKLRRQKKIENKTLALIIELLTSNRFTTHEQLLLIKYILDNHPYPLDRLPNAFREILQGKAPVRNP